MFIQIKVNINNTDWGSLWVDKNLGYLGVKGVYLIP